MKVRQSWYKFLTIGIIALLSQTSLSQESFFREAGEEFQLDNAGYWGVAVAMADYDKDGYIDIFVANAFDNPSVLYHNLNGTIFEEISMPFIPSGTAGGASWGDFDNDGNLDLYLAFQKMGFNTLYHQNSDGTFANVARAMGVKSDNEEWNLSTGWVDFNNDGKLDLFTCNRGQRNNLFLNEGSRFVDVAANVGIKDSTALSTGFAWGDFDNDGDQDLYVTKVVESIKGKNYLYRNDNGKLVEVGEIYHVAGPDKDIDKRTSTDNFGVAWGDYNNDGYLDLYVCGAQGWNHLYRNESGTDFIDVAAELNCADGDTANQHPDFSSSCAWGDYDNDGDLDIFVVGSEREGEKRNTNRLYQNNGSEGFTEVAQEYGMDDTQEGIGCAWGDIDNDGDLDLYVAILGSNELQGVTGGGFDLFYVNELGNRNNWIEINLVGDTSNRSAIGARIRCVTGDLSQIREINGGSGYCSENMLRAHFGLAQHTNVDSLIIHWPSGIVDVLTNVAVNQIMTITEGSGTRVEDYTSASVSGYRLEQNYPNPFNPSTKIEYDLSKASHVKLVVYDVSGREVATLVDSRQSAGHYSVTWDGRDVQDNLLPSGVYIYRMQADRFVKSKKMVFVR